LARRPAGGLRAVLTVLLALAEKAGQLGGEALTGRKLLLRRLHQVDAALELLDVRGRLAVGGDGLGDLLDVFLRRLLELGEVHLRPDELAEAPTEGERRARARCERDVVRHSRPEAHRRQIGLPTSVEQDADDAGRPLVAGLLDAELLDERRR